MQISDNDFAAVQVIWDYMFLVTDPEKADIIIGLGSHDLTVSDDVARLFHSGIAPLVVFAGNVGRITEGMFDKPEAEILRDRALSLGIPSAAILVEDTSTNTGENIVYTQRLLRAHDIDAKNIILVHKPYMLRRDYATFMKQWDGADQVKVSCWASSITLDEYISKVENPAEEIAIMVGDMQRMKVYYEMGYQIEQPIPHEVWSALNILTKSGYTSHLIT